MLIKNFDFFLKFLSSLSKVSKLFLADRYDWLCLHFREQQTNYTNQSSGNMIAVPAFSSRAHYRKIKLTEAGKNQTHKISGLVFFCEKKILLSIQTTVFDEMMF